MAGSVTIKPAHATTKPLTENCNEVKTAGSRKNTSKKKVILRWLKNDGIKESEFLCATSNQIRQLHEYFSHRSSVEVKVE